RLVFSARPRPVPGKLDKEPANHRYNSDGDDDVASLESHLLSPIPVTEKSPQNGLPHYSTDCQLPGKGPEETWPALTSNGLIWRSVTEGKSREEDDCREIP